MADHLDRLFQEWHRLGGAVLLAQSDPSLLVRPAEEVIAESTGHCRESGRLTWVVLDWLIHHVEEVDDRRLLELTANHGDPSVLGLLCDAAFERNPDLKFERLIRAIRSCMPHRELVPFFHRVAQSPLALRLTRDRALEIFRRWNYLCNELRYLGDPKPPSADARPF